MSKNARNISMFFDLEVYILVIFDQFLVSFANSRGWIFLFHVFLLCISIFNMYATTGFW